MALARHLTPAYVKMDGPSIRHLRFSFDEHQLLTSIENSSEELDSLIVTTSMWKSINRWFKKTGLSPIYPLSKAKKTKTKWDFKEMFSLFETTEKLNVKCLWFFECGECGTEEDQKTLQEFLGNRKSLDAYRHDLETLKYITNIFQNTNGSWGIVGGLGPRLSPTEIENDRTLIRSIQNITEAIMWER